MYERFVNHQKIYFIELFEYFFCLMYYICGSCTVQNRFVEEFDFLEVSDLLGSL